MRRARSSRKMPRVLVLLVDDNADLRHLFSLDLRLSGIDVVAVESVAEAAIALAERPVDVLVTDRFLDDGDGEELARRADVQAIVMSGSYERLEVVDERLVLLPKPFTAAVLAALVQERLAAV